MEDSDELVLPEEVTQRDVLNLFNKISGHRDLTETFLGHSDKVRQYK